MDRIDNSTPLCAPWPLGRFVAHRGAGTLAPENTIEALRLGAARGWRAAEFDAMLSSDGVPMLMHDESLSRTCGVEKLLSLTPSREAAAIDAGAWAGPRWRGAMIPTLARALGECSRLQICAQVEIKPSQGAESRTGIAVAQLCRLHSMRTWAPCPVWLSSFSDEALRAARQEAPEIGRGLLLDEGGLLGWEGRARDCGALSLHAHAADGSAQLISKAKENGLRVFFYGVDEPPLARRLFEWGADCVCSDSLESMEKAFPGDFQA